MSNCKLPEAKCAVYTLCDRVKTRDECYAYCLKKIHEYVPNSLLYEYQTMAKDGYKEYCGQPAILYEVNEEKGFQLDIAMDILRNEVNGYSLVSCKKIILVGDRWRDSAMFYEFNLGIDGDNYKELFEDAWKGLLHVWKTADGVPLTNLDRKCMNEDGKLDSEKLCNCEKKPRKPRKKKTKDSTLRYLVDRYQTDDDGHRRHTKSALFPASLIFPNAKGPVF